jgi:hypothetical protein
MQAPEDEPCDFEVFVNPDFQHGDGDVGAFAERFAGWVPEEETSRRFAASDIRSLLSKLEADDTCAEIIGFQEFPYAAGGKLKGNDREVEREYWARLDGVGRRLQGDDKLAIFHVHYAGKWHPVPDRRDRSVVKQINVRHTTSVRDKAFHVKCNDLNKWREKHGSSVLGEIPARGWKWQEEPGLSPPMHRLLTKAERCTRKVRSLRSNVMPGTGNSYTRKALIWSVKKYDSDKVPDLPNAKQDGARLEALLLKFGWDVEWLTDVTLEQAMTSLHEFVDKVGESEDASLVAFFGHGIEFKGQHYLVPRDARLAEQDYRGNDTLLEEDLRQSCLAFGFVEKMVARVRNHKETIHPSLFLLDCCRDGSISTGGPSRAIPGLQPAEVKAVPLDAVKNSIVIYSTTSGNTADDGRAGEGGPFMNAFAACAEVPGERLEDILSKTRVMVEESTARGAKCQLAPHNSLLKEVFYFCPPQVTSPSKGAPGAGAPQVDAELMRLLCEWDLQDAAGALAENGFKTKKKLMLMEEEDISELGLTRGDRRAVKGLLESLQRKGQEAAEGQAYPPTVSEMKRLLRDRGVAEAEISTCSEKKDLQELLKKYPAKDTVVR